MQNQKLSNQSGGDQKNQELRPWKNWVNYDYKEFENQKLKVIDGTIPEDLKGTFFRNTAACLNRAGETPTHLFDGDGAILKVEFKDNQAIGSWKFVQTEAYADEQKAGQYLYQGMDKHAKSFCQRFFSLEKVKNRANTNVLPLMNNNKVLCLFEGGSPYAVDKDNLSTIGIDDLNGHLQPDSKALSAHYRLDLEQQRIYQFGKNMVKGKESLNLKVLDFSGNIIKNKIHDFKGRAFVHDMVIAGDYMVFILQPIYVDVFDLLTTRKTVWGSLKYVDEDCEILVFDKNSLELVKTCQMPKFYFWHFTNGYVNSDGQIVVQLPYYPNNQVNNLFTEMLSGKVQPGTNDSLLTNIIIDLNTGNVKVENTQMDYPCDFPMYDWKYTGKKWDTTYVNVNSRRETGDFFNTVAKYDNNTGKQLLYNVNSQNRYLQEPMPTPDNKYVASLGIHGNGGNSGKDVSELHIINAETMMKECILELPDVLPLTLHGNWDHTQK